MFPVFQVLEIVGNEHVHLSEKQMSELIELLDKEEILEVESKIQKALNKAASAAKEQDKTNEASGKVGVTLASFMSDHSTVESQVVVRLIVQIWLWTNIL